MSMYDTVYCRVPLPECELPADTDFQTKDLGRDLAHYVINADGRLLCCRSMAEDALDLTGAEDTRHDGDIRFYTIGPDKEPCQFLARFARGKLEWIKRDRQGEEAWRAWTRKLHAQLRSGQ